MSCRGKNRLNTHYQKTFVALAIVSAGACACLFALFYNEAKNTAIANLNEGQRIHAKQAAQGIEEFFATWTRNLTSLSKMDEVIDTDTVGERYMALFCEANRDQIRSITRTDERGVIVYNFPLDSSVGADISGQKHMRELLRDHKPVVSDVFKAVEGFDAVALHVPVFRGAEFKGSLGILIDFEILAKRYLDVIKLGKTGYAWVLSRDGTQLYSPIQGFTGKSVFENVKDFPSVIAMATEMVKGHEGTAVYTFDRIGAQNVGQTRKYAVYMPVQIGNTFWSIAVASAEQDVLSGLNSFRNKLAAVIGLLFMGGMVFSTLGARAWLIVKEEEKRRRAEIKNRDAQELMAAVFNSVPGLLYLYTEDGRLIQWNRQHEVMSGYTAEELLNFRIVDWVDEENRATLAKEFSRIFTEGYTQVELNLILKNGQKMPVFATGSRLVIDGKPHMVGIAIDISERKRSEAALLSSEERFRALAESALVGIYILQDGHYTYVNPVMARIFGYSVAEMTGMIPSKIVQPDDHDMVGEHIRRRISGEVQAVHYEVRGRCRDGSTRDVEVYGVGMQVDGKPALVGTLIDITDRRLSEQKMRQQHDELAHMARVHVVSQLASSLAHELNQPLGAILRNSEAAELLLQDPSPDLDELRAILADIRKDDHRAGEVIDRMRDLIRRRPVEHLPLDLNVLVGEVVTLVRPDAEMRRVRLTIETAPVLPPVHGSRVQLQQVLLNLLLNAMDALSDTPSARRRVAVRVRRADAVVEVAVSDNGPGIPADRLSRLFEPFFTTKSNGLGMGLPISLGIIEAHGGRLWAENNADGGATFTFTLPAAGGGDAK
jgi:two-component system cell cycle sensor histidine kinase/response regulator CckA